MQLRYAINHGIPIPAMRQVYPFPEMKPGDSFLVPNENAYASVRVAMRLYGRKTNKTFTARKTIEGLRIWRTK